MENIRIVERADDKPGKTVEMDISEENMKIIDHSNVDITQLIFVLQGRVLVEGKSKLLEDARQDYANSRQNDPDNTPLLDYLDEDEMINRLVNDKKYETAKQSHDKKAEAVEVLKKQGSIVDAPAPIPVLGDK